MATKRGESNSGDAEADVVVNARFGTFARVGPRMEAAHTHIFAQGHGPYLDVWAATDGVDAAAC
jgi:hypothetical protein